MNDKTDDTVNHDEIKLMLRTLLTKPFIFRCTCILTFNTQANVEPVQTLITLDHCRRKGLWHPTVTVYRYRNAFTHCLPVLSSKALYREGQKVTFLKTVMEMFT